MANYAKDGDDSLRKKRNKENRRTEDQRTHEREEKCQQERKKVNRYFIKGTLPSSRNKRGKFLHLRWRKLEERDILKSDREQSLRANGKECPIQNRNRRYTDQDGVYIALYEYTLR